MQRGGDERVRHDKYQVIVLLLGQAGALSGGDVHALRLVQALARSSNCSVRLVGGDGLHRFVQGSAIAKSTTCIATPFDRAMRRSTVALVCGITWRMISAIRRSGVGHDVVIASSHLIFDVVVTVVVARRSNARAVAFVYHLIVDMDRPRGWRTTAASCAEGLSLRLLRRSRATVFVDNDEAESGLVARGFDPTRIHRTENAYDPEPSELAHISSTVKSAGTRLLFIGRMVEQKGVWDVVDVARALRCAEPSATVVMLGDGPEREAVEAVAREESLDNLRILGFVDEAQKWRHLVTSDLFLAPSREEGWGIAVGEALLAGVPVIALDLPAYRHFPVALSRVPTGGAPFVQRVLELVADPVELDRQRREVQRMQSSLPQWADVLRADIETLEAILADASLSAKRDYPRFRPRSTGRRKSEA